MLDGGPDLEMHAQTFLQAEICYAVKMPAETRLEVQTSGLCEDSNLSDTFVRVFEPDFSLTAEDDDGSDVGLCSFLVTPPLPPATRIVCISGYQGAAIDATVAIRLGEHFAPRDAACAPPSVLRGCDPAAIDSDDDGTTDSLSCLDGRCTAKFHVAPGGACAAGIDTCAVGECVSFSVPTETTCGVPTILDDGAVCEPGLTGIRCDDGVRCLPSPDGADTFTCQDCVAEDGARPLLFCSRHGWNDNQCSVTFATICEPHD